MLKKFNQCISKYICESSENEDEKTKSIEKLSTHEFYYKFIVPVVEEVGGILEATVQRENTFLVAGSLKDIKKFFAAFKVDDSFMEKPADFQIYTPMFTYGEIIHNMKFDEDYPIYHTAEYGTYTHEDDNLARNVVEGRWYPFIDEETSKKLKAVKPSEISKYFKSFYPKADKAFNEDCIIYVEFQVNCRGLANALYDDMSEYAKTEDEMNEAHQADAFEDFDYDVLLKVK